MKTQTLDQAREAIEAANMITNVVMGELRVYDPRRPGAYAIIESGYSDAECSDYCLPAQPDKKTGKKSTGAHQDDVRRILATARK